MNCKFCKSDKNLLLMYTYDTKNACQCENHVCESCSDQHCIEFENELYDEKYFKIDDSDDQESIELK